MSHQHTSPRRIANLEIPEREGTGGVTVRQADRLLLGKAPAGSFLDTTHFDTVRFPPPDWALEIFAEAARAGELAYTGYRGHTEVLAAVAASAGTFVGLPLDSDKNVLLTPGTQGGLFSTIGALAQSGDKVVLFDPEYLFDERMLRFLGAEVMHVRLVLDDGEPHPDMQDLERAFAAGARLLIFSNPNNPSGAVFSRAVLGEIGQLADKYDVVVVVDELYARLVYEGEYTHFAALPGMADRTVTLLGPSKTESLSGYRLGVVAAPARIAVDIENVLSITSLRAPAYSQHLLTRWLKSDGPWLASRLEDFRALRSMTLAAFRRLPWLKITEQRGTAYAWPDLAALNLSAREVAEQLMSQAAVLVSPGYQFGPQSSTHLRVCYARDESEWQAALSRIVAVLDGMATSRGLPPAA